MGVDRKTKRINDLIRINHYDDVNECFVMNDGSFLDIIKIRGHDLLNSDEDKILYECFTLLKWIKTYPHEYEIIGMNFPVDTTEQQIYFEHIISRTENPQYLYYLNQKLTELKTIDRRMIEKQFYLFLFYETEEALRLQREKTLLQLGKAALLETIPRFHKELVLYKINNKNLPVPKEKIRQHNGEQQAYYHITAEQEKRNQNAGYDAVMLGHIGVAGNISFPTDDRFVKTGTGYEACIYVYGYPETLERHWLCQLFNIDHAITSIHLSPKNMKEVKKNINKSLGEQESGMLVRTMRRI